MSPAGGYTGNGSGRDRRDHLLEALHRAVDFGARGDVVFDFVDEGRVGYPSRVRGGVFAVVHVSLLCAVEGLVGARDVMRVAYPFALSVIVAWSLESES